MKPSVADIRIGALYRFGAARRLDQGALARLVAERARLTPEKAQQLVAHWMTTEPYRQRDARHDYKRD